MQTCLHDQLGCNMEAYIDDIIIKSRVKEDLVADLSEIFGNLRRFRWKLNPEKCAFGVSSGKLFSFVSEVLGRMQVQPISELCKRACTISSGATWKHTLTISSSSLGLRKILWPTYPRYSAI